MTFKRLHYAVSFLLKRGVMLKKIISISLSFFILVQSFFFCFYSTPAYGAPLDVDTDLLEDMASNPEKYEPASMKLTEFLLRTVTGGQALDKFFGTSSQELISNIKALFLKEGNCKTDGNNYYLTQNFTNEFNQAVQGKVHDMDGYWLITPANTWDINKIISWKKSKGYILPEETISSFKKIMSGCLAYWKNGPYSDNFFRFDISDLLYYEKYYIYLYPERGKYGSQIKCASLNKSSCSESTSTAYFSSVHGYDATIKYMLEFFTEYSYGAQFKIFQSYDSLERYLNNGKVRTYAPQLPSTTISIPIKYINNSVSLPDITYNINTTNKTEVEIQNEYNTTLNNYLNDLNNFTDGPEVTPTPTPDGGFTDSTTPTPKPDFGDGSDLTDTNDWLKKIYEWLQSFGDTHSKFEQTITDYIEANDGKLDQIIEAINALSDGKTEDEKNGCKYDFTALSDFMTKLWNESDKKFDKMVELLEENNKYQKKLVNSLNEIKAILVTQTIMDVFQDRSQQTAEKAKDKFPTSLPWDIALVVNAMSAEPEKPQFNLPIKIKSLNINEEIHVDLASGEWEKLAKTCRYLLSILFILLMIQLSRKLFSNGGDD